MLVLPVPSVSGSKRRNAIDISSLSSSLICSLDRGLNAVPSNSKILVFQYLAILMAASYRINNEVELELETIPSYKFQLASETYINVELLASQEHKLMFFRKQFWAEDCCLI